MSHALIQHYLNQLQDLRKVSGTTRESVLREAFKDLLKSWGKQHNLVFIPEYKLDTLTRDKRYVDGALLYELRVPFGYWEAKDSTDDLDEEIIRKFKRGYPKDNIIFEDTTRAVLIQNGQRVLECPVDDVDALKKLLTLFFSYERTEIAEFRKAVEQFKTDLPAVLEALRGMIERAHTENPEFRKESERFLIHAQEAINPSLTDADVREMLIQHVLTEEIFAKVFPDTPFHKDNNVARELYKLEATFFTGNTKFQSLKALAPYYSAISAAAAQIERHHEKQAFLKVIYENFYKVYNKKAADRLGVVYTPNEIVRFMIESADWLCEKHFGKNLIDHEVEILDPATGTGTFITELLEHFRGQPAKLKHKYLQELHANEVAILPYYVANLNIEATYAAITGQYLEFPNLCFVDTLDNVGLHTAQHGSQGALFGGVSEENVARIKRQNGRKISVIVGNPPYNAWQENFNLKNPNRPYQHVDDRIRKTYQELGTAQNQIALYDMYVRFFRWASDRLAENGVLAFISNRSFLDSLTFDGFRKALTTEFNEVWVVDLGGDVRENPKLSGTTHNVFGIQTGVAISFLVRRHRAQGCRIFYSRRPEMETAEEKLAFLDNAKLETTEREEIKPDSRHNWINQTHNDFDLLLPVIDKTTKAAKNKRSERALFKLFSAGVKTQRDEWVYDFSSKTLETKMKFFVEQYERERITGTHQTKDLIKWDRELDKYLNRGIEKHFNKDAIVPSLYRPFCKQWFYFDRHFNGMVYQWASIMPTRQHTNRLILYTQPGSQKPFMVGSAETVCDLHFVGAAAGSECLPFYRYDDAGNRTDNITDWALDQFKKQYQPGRTKQNRPITKEAIFHYVYGVLHDPVYRETYAQNLKREFPRIPFYADFWQWADWGKELMELHIGYEQTAPAKLTRTDIPDEKSLKAGVAPKAMLKSDKDSGCIVLDSETTLSGIPREAWTYTLGNRSALEWILDQYKEKKPKDPTIREKFDSYRFADYKEKVIDLLARVTTVSIRTVSIVNSMKQAAR
ncbi:MAG: type ISP restriction/modification enzyme [Nitrospirota bacterium]